MVKAAWAQPGTGIAGGPGRRGGASPIAGAAAAVDRRQAGRALVRPGPAVPVHGSQPMLDRIRTIVPSSGEDGQGLAEYALILALIAVVAIIALIFLGTQISSILDEVATNI
jgi:pilus assembly protein Flp/PilA